MHSQVGWSFVISLVFGLPVLTGTASAVPITLRLDPRATFLHTYNEPNTVSAPPIVLGMYGIQAGDYIVLERLGAYARGTEPFFLDIATDTIGIFSSSGELRHFTENERVPGAIYTSRPAFYSEPTFYGQRPTDIPQDFDIDRYSPLLLQVPGGATHLFVTAHDSHWSTNHDPNGDYAIRITPVPEPASLAIAALAGLGVVAGLRLRNRTPQTSEVSADFGSLVPHSLSIV